MIAIATIAKMILLVFSNSCFLVFVAKNGVVGYKIIRHKIHSLYRSSIYTIKHLI
jgi:hypothetical protein